MLGRDLSAASQRETAVCMSRREHSTQLGEEESKGTELGTESPVQGAAGSSEGLKPDNAGEWGGQGVREPQH